MTNITLIVAGAKAHAEVSGVLTAGMVGIPVSIKFDEAWDGLTKNLVCRCGKWGPGRGDTRTVLNVGDSATVAHEVMQAETTLYLGVEGYRADGSLVMPTIWANCGFIHPGANADGDPSTDPSLPIWAQLQAAIVNCVGRDEVDAVVRAYLEENPIEIPDPCCLTEETITVGEDAGGIVAVSGIALDYTSASLQVGGQLQLAATVSPGNATNTAVIWETSDSGVATVSDGLVTAVAEGSAVITVRSADNSAITATCSVAVAAAESGEGEGEDPGTESVVTLTGISAAYSGGDVAAGTAVTALTGIVVTAQYSDGSTKNVTGYTLSGTIGEGSNTITVSYEGKTATFTVTGTAAATGTKVQFSTLEMVSGFVNASGTVVSLTKTYHVTLPYSEGMQISTGTNDTWSTDTYPPIVVLDGGTYSAPATTKATSTITVSGSVVTPHTATLTGYSADAVVYVSFLAGAQSTTELLLSKMDAADIYYYIPGGDA